MRTVNTATASGAFRPLSFKRFEDLLIPLPAVVRGYGTQALSTWIAPPLSQGGVSNEWRWEMPFSAYGFAGGNGYRVEISNFCANISNDSRFERGAKSWIAVEVDVVDGDGIPRQYEEWRFSADTEPYIYTGPGANYHDVRCFNWDTFFNEDFQFEFALEDGADYTGYMLAFRVSIMIVGYESSEYGVSSYAPWFGFDGVLVRHISSAESEWQDEQRGFWARILEFLQGIWDAVKSIPEFIAELPQKILDGLKSLFVPGEGEIEAIILDYQEYAEGKLGFVAQLVKLIPTVIGPMLEAGDGDVIIVLPRVYLSGAFGGIELWQEQGLNLTQVIAGNNWLSLFYGMYKVLASVLLLGLILRYMYRVMHDILGQQEEE